MNSSSHGLWPSLPQLISLAVFLLDSVMGDEISSKAKDLNFSQERHENRKMEIKKMMNSWTGMERGKEKKVKHQDRLKYFVLLLEGK